MPLKKILSNGYKFQCKINNLILLMERQQTIYFKLERGTRQGDRISAYLFILVLKTALLFIMQYENINGLNIFENTFLYTTYAYDTTFFLKDANL